MTEKPSMSGLWRSAFLAFCVTLLVCFSEEQVTYCVSCTYTFAGDGSTDRECVTNPSHHANAQNIRCTFNNRSCEIRAVYSDLSYAKIQSLTRSCAIPTNNPFNCDSYTPSTCVRQCKEDRCNSGDGDIWKIYSPTNTAEVITTSTVSCKMKYILFYICAAIAYFGV